MSNGSVNDNTALMVGLPETGKTTFLAAFYHVTESASLRDALTLEVQPEVRTYLERIRRDWLNLTRQTRNVQQDITHTSMKIRHPQTGGVVSLFFPDPAGEAFRLMVEERTLSVELDTVIASCDRALVFIHPGVVKRGATIKEAEVIATELEINNDDEPHGHAQNAESIEVPWTPDLLPTQVCMVDILQVLEERSHVGIKRLAIIVSAWDLLRNVQPSPGSYIQLQLPLLWQFLEARKFAGTECRIFGVSAQGGDLKSDRERLTKFADPIKRIDLNGISRKEGNIHDITFPVKWVLS